MNNLAVINSVSVEFSVVGDEVFADTLKIAEVFEKNHQHILRTIKNLPNDDFKAENFKPSTYLDAQMKPRPCYALTRDGFSLLVMGFTGEKAYQWKIEFIKAFNMMEAELKRQGEIRYVDEISNLKADAELEAKKCGRKLAYYKGEITKAKNALASYRAKITSRSGFPARINSTELSALNKELTDVKHEAISNMSEVFRLRGEIEDLAGELALANGTITSQKEYIARLSSAVVQASIEQAQAPAAMRHELELLQSDLACLQNKLSAAMSKLKEQSERNKLYLKDER